MPKVRSTLTRREQRCLIDFNAFSPEREDFTLILFCSRIVVRIQLKCFEAACISIEEIQGIIHREIERFPEKLARFSAQLRAFGHYYNLIDVTRKVNHIGYSKNPLESIREAL